MIANRKKVKNRGFTITEVITTLVILGVVLAIAIPGVGKLQAKFREDYYEQLNGSVVAAAKTYFKDNAESKPSGDLAVVQLLYSSLTGAKYIDSIKAYKDDNSCAGYIAVLKAKDQYIYKNCMRCASDGYDNYSDSIRNIDDGETEDEKNSIASSNICALAGKDSTQIETLHNTADPEPLYLYAGSYNGQDLKDVLAINEEISLKADGAVAYRVSTGNKIYPKNITGIDLSKESVNDSAINTGIKVSYENNENRTIHVYNYKAPIVSNSNGRNVNTDGVVRSTANSVQLNLSSIYFGDNSAVNKYPKAQTLGPDFSSKLTPTYNGTRFDKLANYYYTVDGTHWIQLSCGGKHECEINSKTLEKADKIKFKMSLTTQKGTFNGRETSWYDVKNLLSVSFDANGGNIDSGQISKEVETGQKYGSLPIANKVGYSFNGWQTNKNGGETITEDTKVSQENDHTIFAKWQIKTYVVTLNANGGSIEIDDKNYSSHKISVEYNEKIGVLPEPKREGYTFKGWYTSLSGGTQATSDTVMGDGDISVLYARWALATPVVTLDANGGSVSPASMTVEYTSTYGSFPTPTRAGYTFVGWFNENYKTDSLNYYADAYWDLKNAFGYNQDSLWTHYLNHGQGEGRQISQYISTTKVTNAKPHTLYAGWIANSYVVTLNANGGSVSPGSLTIKYGAQYGTLREPTRSGYVFNGWYTAESGGTQISSTTTMNTASNHTLYAQWTEIITVSKTSTDCATPVSIPAGVYYIEIVGGGAGGKGKSGGEGGNAARWSGYVYLPGSTSSIVCVGKGSSKAHGVIGGTPSNGSPSYITNASGSRWIEAMGGKSYANTPYSASITNIGNGAVTKLVCKNIVGAKRGSTSIKYGYGGYTKSIFETYGNGTDGTSGIIKYQYVKSLSDWETSPLTCPTSSLCSSSDCGW